MVADLQQLGCALARFGSGFPAWSRSDSGSLEFLSHFSLMLGRVGESGSLGSLGGACGLAQPLRVARLPAMEHRYAQFSCVLGLPSTRQC